MHMEERLQRMGSRLPLYTSQDLESLATCSQNTKVQKTGPLSVSLLARDLQYPMAGSLVHPYATPVVA
jgi:hypothetical protein